MPHLELNELAEALGLVVVLAVGKRAKLVLEGLEPRGFAGQQDVSGLDFPKTPIEPLLLASDGLHHKKA